MKKYKIGMGTSQTRSFLSKYKPQTIRPNRGSLRGFYYRD